MGGLPDHVFGLKQAAELALRADPPPGETAAERLRGVAAALSAEQEREPAPLRSLDDPWARDQATYNRVMGEIVHAMDAITDWAHVN
jgi:hypothetical protein